MVLILFICRLWGTAPTFSRDDFLDYNFSPSILEAGVAAEVEWLVLKKMFFFLFFKFSFFENIMNSDWDY